MFDANYGFFKAHLNELLEQYPGRFIAIKDEAVIGDYAGFDAACEDVSKREDLGTFLIQHCVNDGTDVVIFVSDNAVFS